jgi:hypothetical protein
MDVALSAMDGAFGSEKTPRKLQSKWFELEEDRN